MYKIFDMRTFGLSHQIKGPTTVKVAKLAPIHRDSWKILCMYAASPHFKLGLEHVMLVD